MAGTDRQATIRIRGRDHVVGDRIFNGPDFYAILVEGDNTFLVVHDEDYQLGEGFCLFEWDAQRATFDRDSGKANGRGTWVLVSMAFDNFCTHELVY